MITEQQKIRIVEMREKGLTNKEIANALEISESTVNRHTPQDFSKDNEIAKELGVKLEREGFDFENEVKRFIYALENSAEESNLSLWTYLKEYEDIKKNYKRLSRNPKNMCDCFWNIAYNMDFIEETFDISVLVEIIDDFIDRNIYISEIEGVIDKKEKESKEWDKTIKLKHEQVKNLEKKTNALSNLFMIMFKKLSKGEKVWVEETQEENKVLKQQIDRLKHQITQFKEIEIEKNILNKTLREFEQRFPNEVKQFAKEFNEA